MGQIIAFCGINCINCPAFIATRENNSEKRREIANVWSTPEYNLKPEDVNCDGCPTVNRRLISFVKVCDIRNCGMERKVENCAHCINYPCERLTKCHERSPEAKSILDDVHQQLSK